MVLSTAIATASSYLAKTGATNSAGVVEATKENSLTDDTVMRWKAALGDLFAIAATALSFPKEA